MTGESDLLAAVARDPWADAPRLVLADWWDDHGQRDRAEFARVQLELARSVPTFDRDESYSQVDNPRYTALRRREEDLLLTGFARWSLPAIEASGIRPALSPERRGCRVPWTNVGINVRARGGHIHPSGDVSGARVGWQFARGFPATLTLPLAAFLADPARVGRVTGLTGVVLGDREPAEERERDGGDRFRWVCNDGSASGLPEAVHSRLTRYTTDAAWTGVVKDYPTRSAAVHALSAAALALARSAAGLDPA
jgi:uncharacterized protein (TIGR02996 family)